MPHPVLTFNHANEVETYFAVEWSLRAGFVGILTIIIIEERTRYLYVYGVV